MRLAAKDGRFEGDSFIRPPPLRRRVPISYILLPIIIIIIITGISYYLYRLPKL